MLNVYLDINFKMKCYLSLFQIYNINLNFYLTQLMPINAHVLIVFYSIFSHQLMLINEYVLIFFSFNDALNAAKYISTNTPSNNYFFKKNLNKNNIS